MTSPSPSPTPAATPNIELQYQVIKLISLLVRFEDDWLPQQPQIVSNQELFLLLRKEFDSIKFWNLHKIKKQPKIE